MAIKIGGEKYELGEEKNNLIYRDAAEKILGNVFHRMEPILDISGQKDGYPLIEVFIDILNGNIRDIQSIESLLRVFKSKKFIEELKRELKKVKASGGNGEITDFFNYLGGLIDSGELYKSFFSEVIEQILNEGEKEVVVDNKKCINSQSLASNYLVKNEYEGKNGTFIKAIDLELQEIIYLIKNEKGDFVELENSRQRNIKCLKIHGYIYFFDDEGRVFTLDNNKLKEAFEGKIVKEYDTFNSKWFEMPLVNGISAIYRTDNGKVVKIYEGRVNDLYLTSSRELILDYGNKLLPTRKRLILNKVFREISENQLGDEAFHYTTEWKSNDIINRELHKRTEGLMISYISDTRNSSTSHS